MLGIGTRHLRCFLEVARLGSVGQAAEALAISQPAVSKTLRELEDRLGVDLFDRAGRRLRLTEAGRVFQKHAGLSVAELQRGVRAVSRPEAARRRVRVGVLPTVATRIMPKAALAFAKAVPGGTLRISTGPNWLLLSQLRDGELDLVIGRLAEPEAMTGLVFEQILVESVVAIVRPGHPMTEDPGRVLDGFPLVLPPAGAIIRPVVERFFLSLGRETPQAFVETVSLAVGRGIVQGSDAVWLISRGVAEVEIDAGTLVAVPLPGSPTAGPVGLTLRSGAEPSVEMRTLMTALRSAVPA